MPYWGPNCLQRKYQDMSLTDRGKTFNAKTKGQGARRGEIGPVTEMCKNAICF